MTPTECGSPTCSWPHTFTVDGKVEVCTGRGPRRLRRLLARLVPWL